jgi:hypothetical protein
MERHFGEMMLGCLFLVYLPTLPFVAFTFILLSFLYCAPSRYDEEGGGGGSHIQGGLDKYLKRQCFPTLSSQKRLRIC